MNKFAERLKELRKDLNITQDQLAAETKISQAAISSYENGLQSPTIDVVIILCKYFKVSADYMIGLSD